VNYSTSLRLSFLVGKKDDNSRTQNIWMAIRNQGDNGYNMLQRVPGTNEAFKGLTHQI
jgi:hypothetical protein